MSSRNYALLPHHPLWGGGREHFPVGTACIEDNYLFPGHKYFKSHPGYVEFSRTCPCKNDHSLFGVPTAFSLKYPDDWTFCFTYIAYIFTSVCVCVKLSTTGCPLPDCHLLEEQRCTICSRYPQCLEHALHSWLSLATRWADAWGGEQPTLPQPLVYQILCITSLGACLIVTNSFYRVLLSDSVAMLHPTQVFVWCYVMT